MDKFLDKLGIFDLFSLFLPGMTFLSLAAFAVYDFFAVLSRSAFLSGIRQLMTVLKDSNQQVVLSLLFLAFSYIAGLAIRQVCVLLERRIGTDKRKSYYTIPAKDTPLTLEGVLIDRVMNHVAGRLGVKNPDAKWKYENQRFIHQFCMTSLEIEGGIAKAERMSSVSEMSASFVLIFSLYALLYLVFAGVSCIYQCFMLHYLVVAVCSALLAVLFYHRYNLFARFRVNSTLKSYYVKFVQKS